MEELRELPLVQVLYSFYDGTAEPYQWGILAGCCVYVATVLVVVYLLVAGGSFQRMREQVSGEAFIDRSVEPPIVRSHRITHSTHSSTIPTTHTHTGRGVREAGPQGVPGAADGQAPPLRQPPRGCQLPPGTLRISMIVDCSREVTDRPSGHRGSA